MKFIKYRKKQTDSWKCPPFAETQARKRVGH